ncbi:MAG: UDP-N-acetylmuramoyl-tripeptide--D-alanyl-D-alanine ligase [Candidatus Harrisonbacteria bacterium]|nr:UDP-N-acetylmuramoyl-tripeptide--D-alanyl-D-alanine ligase [Candidatus Harrisonbacteria bacterium]
MNKEKLQQYLQTTLRLLAMWTLRKYQPGVIGVTGSVGKTSSKEAIYTVLKKHRNVRKSSGNFNNEIGLPLTILGDWQIISGKLFWIKAIAVSVLHLIFRMRYPELLVLEYAADKPGDIKYLLDIARPQIGVVTTVGNMPVHVEFYSGPEAVAREKSKIIEALSVTGFAILNYDDEIVLNMKERTRAHIMTFGFGEGAQVQMTNYETRMEGERPAGIAFKLNYGGSFVPIRLDGCFGKAQAYAAAAAACVGIAFGLNLVKIAEALWDYSAPPGRGKIISGIKHSYILDDSYNASPLSVEAAIHTIRSWPAKRKVAVLGDMLELGKYTVEAHEGIGKLIPDNFDILVTVGSRAKFIGESAKAEGMNLKNIYSFDTAEEAAPEVQKLIRKGDLILVKGSHGIRLDKIVEEIQQF